ncbi:MAG TPA: hypothetical protein VJA21_15325 [Verrucomicrobiae bacterium]
MAVEDPLAKSAGGRDPAHHLTSWVFLPEISVPQGTCRDPGDTTAVQMFPLSTLGFPYTLSQDPLQQWYRQDLRRDAPATGER